jgi:hypothetical protein
MNEEIERMCRIAVADADEGALRSDWQGGGELGIKE